MAEFRLIVVYPELFRKRLRLMLAFVQEETYISRENMQAQGTSRYRRDRDFVKSHPALRSRKFKLCSSKVECRRRLLLLDKG